MRQRNRHSKAHCRLALQSPILPAHHGVPTRGTSHHRLELPGHGIAIGHCRCIGLCQSAEQELVPRFTCIVLALMIIGLNIPTGFPTRLHLQVNTHHTTSGAVVPHLCRCGEQCMAPTGHRWWWARRGAAVARRWQPLVSLRRDPCTVTGPGPWPAGQAGSRSCAHVCTLITHTQPELFSSQLQPMCLI